MPPLRLAALVLAALTGFAANSLLCRAALASGAIDAASFTGVRLASGAIVLGLLSAASGRRSPRAGSFRAAALLFAYAAAFSFAYVSLPAGTGALILFGAVQLTMIGFGLARGERLGAASWVGLVLAAAGLTVLAAPGLGAPSPLPAALMAAAGLAWGGYSLLGRGALRPLAATADNFLRATVPAVALVALAVPVGLHASLTGLALAAASGAIASGIGYALWYAALPSLRATSAAVLQLGVPVLAAAGGVLFLGEALSMRLAVAAALILGGVALALVRRGAA